MRTFADDAREEIRQELGPAVQDFGFQDLGFKDVGFQDLDPRTFLTEHVLGDDDTAALRELRDGLRIDSEAEELRGIARTLGSAADLTKARAGGPAPTETAPTATVPYDTDAT